MGCVECGRQTPRMVCRDCDLADDYTTTAVGTPIEDESKD